MPGEVETTKINDRGKKADVDVKSSAAQATPLVFGQAERAPWTSTSTSHLPLPSLSVTHHLALFHPHQLATPGRDTVHLLSSWTYSLLPSCPSSLSSQNAGPLLRIASRTFLAPRLVKLSTSPVARCSSCGREEASASDPSSLRLCARKSHVRPALCGWFAHHLCSIDIAPAGHITTPPDLSFFCLTASLVPFLYRKRPYVSPPPRYSYTPDGVER